MNSPQANAANALCDQAIALHQQGRLAEAEQLYVQVRRLAPGHVNACYLHGVIQHDRGQFALALNSLDAALASNPRMPAALLYRGLCLEALNRDSDALASYGKAIALQPDMVEALGNRANLLCRMDRAGHALADCYAALKYNPNFVPALFSKGLALAQMGRIAEALGFFDRTLQLAPDFAIAHAPRGAALHALGRSADALAAYERAPLDFDTLSGIGKVLHGMERYPEALAAYDGALKIKQDATVHNNRGGALQNMRRMQEARAAYDAALALEPNHTEALNNRATLLWQHFRDREAALADREKLLSLDPNHEYGLGHLILLRLTGGDWQGFEALKEKADAGVRAGKHVVRPYIFQAISSSPEDLQRCSRIYTAQRHPALPAVWRPRQNQKIKLGYLCGEFREQATSFLAAGLWEKHDKSRFELFAFDNDRGDGTAMRARIEASFDHMTPIAHLGDDAAAAAIAEAGIDILVNLNGYFGLPRMGVFARKPAPIQVNYLGFPATLGAPYMDYIIADRIVIPEQEAGFYDEKIAWLPDSYQANDNARIIGADTSRAAHGLPDGAFVFCNFNQSYKLLPETFDSWMRILAAVPESVLWLWDNNPAFMKNLRREAEARGMEPSRLIFAPTAGHADHLARLTLADLALDQLPYNAHTTASDALWAGLPLVTQRGTAFPGRVAASLLSAIDLPELITENSADFEARAIALAQNPGELAALRAKLAANRGTAALFDTPRYTSNIEAAYQAMFDRFQRGEKPESFSV